MAKKHYDNKRDLIREMRQTQKRSETAIAATYTAYMLMALYTLHEDFGFGQKRANKFYESMYKRIEEYGDGELSVPEMQKTIFNKLGMIVEGPDVR